MVDALTCFDSSLGGKCGTYATSPESSSDHPCNAADCEPGAIGVCPEQSEIDEGWRAANWLRANAATLKVSYVIFDAKIWSVARSASGWRQYCVEDESEEDKLRCYEQGACTTENRCAPCCRWMRLRRRASATCSLIAHCRL